MSKSKSKAKSGSRKAQVVEEDCSRYDSVCERVQSEYTDAVSRQDIGGILKLKYFIEDLDIIGRPILQQRLMNLNLFKDDGDLIKKLRTEWINTLDVGKYVDAYSPSEFKWFECKILIIEKNEGRMKVHYNGWDSKYDDYLSFEDSKLCPVHCFSSGKRTYVKKIKKPTFEIVISEPKVAPVAAPVAAEAELVTGRRRCRVDALQLPAALPENNNTDSCSKKRRGSEAPEGETDENKEDMENGTERGNRGKGKKKAGEEKDRNDWVCTVCGWFEAPDGSDLICCDALCKRSFHLGCLEGKMTAPMGEKAWYCDDCVLGQHLCFVCKKRGIDSQDVHKCSAPHCGKFYHRSCLEIDAEDKTILATQFKIMPSKEVLKVVAIPLPGYSESTESLQLTTEAISLSHVAKKNVGKGRARLIKSSLSNLSAVELSETAETGLPQNCTFELRKERVDNVLVFKCPLHACYNCFEFHGVTDVSDLNQCLSCPRSFHTNCIVPGSRFNSMCVLCPRHPTDSLPNHDVRLNPKVVNSRKSAPVNEFSVFWEQLAVPEDFPNPQDPYDNHFRLQMHIKDSAEDVPQTFTKISRNDYDTFPEGKPVQGFVAEVACECKFDCGDDCLNRILRIECCDTKIKSGGADGRGSSDKCICAIGPNCANRALQSKKYAKTEPFREFQMGWGLRAKEDIEAGALIMEYVGEVIDTAEVQRRMTAQRQNTPLDKDFYIMELDNGMFVDGKFKGSTSRYINHSCDPNCELQRWVVKGYPRIGIFALRDICNGEALSYDYQFDTNEAEAFKCYCGTEKCRGTMAPNKKKAVQFDAQGRPVSKEDRNRLILMGKMRAQALGKLGMVEAEWNRSYTGRFLPGDPINEIRNGPVKSAVNNGRQAHLLLARNVRCGANMFDRSQRLRNRDEKLAAKLKAICTYKTSKGMSTERNVSRSGAAATRTALLRAATADSELYVAINRALNAENCSIRAGNETSVGDAVNETKHSISAVFL